MDAEPDEPPDNSYAAVRAIFLKYDFKASRKQHLRFCKSNGERGQHIDLCATLCLHHEVDGAEDKLIAVFSTLWQLLGLGWQINSGWPLILHGDASFNVCRSEVGFATLGINILGGHYRNVAATIMGGARETKQVYETC